MNLKTVLRRVTAVMLAVLLATSLFGGLALADESTRIARIDSVSGEVMVKKAGGSKEFKAYRNMTLNQGDHIRTGKDSSAVLTVLDQEDKITIGSNTSMYLSELKEAGGGKSTKMNLWNGSAYINASKKSGNDQFRVETPTAVMGIRGTHFTVSHGGDETDITVHSGVVEASVEAQPDDDDAPGNVEKQELLLFPTMKAYVTRVFDELQGASKVESGVAVIDPASMKLDLAILYAVVENKQLIDAENEQILQQIESGAIPLPPELGVETEQDLELLATNVTSFVKAVVHTALQQELITEEEANELAAIGNFDLSEPVQYQLSEEQRRRQQQLEELQRRKEQQAREQEQRREQIRQQNEELMNEIRNRREQQEQENEEARRQTQQDVLDRYLSNLSEEERQQFLERQQQLEQGQGEQTTDTPAPPASDDDGGFVPPPPQPDPDPEPGPEPDPEPEPEPEPDPEPVPDPEPEFAIVEAALANIGDYTLDYRLSVMDGTNPVSGLTKEHFRVEVNGSEWSASQFQVTPIGPSHAYEVSIFIGDVMEVGSVVIEVTHDGNTADVSLDDETIVVRAPIASFDAMSGNQFNVNLTHFSNIKGVELHVVYSENLTFIPGTSLTYDSVVASERTVTGYYDGLDSTYMGIERIYAFVLKPGQGSVLNDIGESETVYSFELHANQDEGMVVLARLIVITEQGTYTYDYMDGMQNNLELYSDPAYMIFPGV